MHFLKGTEIYEIHEIARLQESLFVTKPSDWIFRLERFCVLTSAKQSKRVIGPSRRDTFHLSYKVQFQSFRQAS